jgi:hypothetical protein
VLLLEASRNTTQSHHLPKQANYDLEFFAEINRHYIETTEGSPMDGLRFYIPVYVVFLSSPVCPLSTNMKYWALVEVVIVSILVK